MEKSNSKVKDTESDSSMEESDHVNNEANGSAEPNEFAMDQQSDAEVNNVNSDLDIDDTNENVPQTKTSDLGIQEKKTPAKGKKRKSTSLETPINSKLPKYEPVELSLETKTIYIKEGDAFKYKSLDRAVLTSCQPKEGTFEVGDLIWAKMVGFPWWPCLVSVDPETGNYSKITGSSCKADRVYHVQYFGPEAYRGWTTIGMAMSFEGIDMYYEKINSEINNSDKKKTSKILEKCIVKPKDKKKWNESVSEAELALKLDKRERIRRLTFRYVVGSESKEAKSRKSKVSISLPASTANSVSEPTTTPQASKAIPVNKTAPSTNKKKTTNRRKSASNNKANKSTEDVYDFDNENEDGLDNEPLPGLVFRKRVPKGDFQVYSRKHFDDQVKENPDCTKAEINEKLKKQWREMTEDMRSVYIERKAIYEDDSNMLVSKRSHFGDDYFNDDSDYDYNDSDREDNKDSNSADGDKSNSLAPNNSDTPTKPKRSRKSKKSEKLFDQIKKEDSAPVIDDIEFNGGIKRRSSLGTKAQSNLSSATPVKHSVIKKEIKISISSVPKPTDSAKSDKANKSKINSDVGSKKKLCFEELSDETNSSDAASVNDVELGGESKKIKPVERFCHECGDQEVENNIVECEGICNRMYHKECIEFSGTGNVFCCEECKTNQHKCFACKSEVDLDTKKCEDSKCNLFYHLKCIENHYPIKVNESANSFLCPVHTCLTCHLETLNDKEYRANKKKLHKCLFCPTAYHTAFCMPAGTLRVSKSYVICPDHFQQKNQASKGKDRHINVNYCFACLSGGNLICCESCPSAFHETCLEYSFDHDKSFYCATCSMHKQLLYGDIVWVKLGSYRWWPGRICHPNIVPENVMNLSHNDGDFPVYFFGSHDYYWVNKGRAYLFVEGDNQAATANVGNKSGSSKTLKTAFKLALNEASNAFDDWNKEREKKVSETIANKPPPYQHISANRYVAQKANVNGESSEHICDCKGELSCADENCLNRISLIECDPKLCPNGENCKNQRYRKCEYVKCKPFKTKSAGWGLMALEDIKEGDFVIEYCGEVIDEKECDKRLKKIASTQSNFYFLNLDKDLFIDAGPKGNLARFMNHSCEPNCVTQKWVVNNLTRVGLFALHDIPSGTELTFNYNLDCRGNERIKCECNSAKCSGFIGERLKNEDAQSKRVVNGSKLKNGKQKNKSKASAR